MSELMIAVLAFVFMLIVFFRVRKGKHKLPEPATPVKESKPADKPILNAEPVKETSTEPKAKQALPASEPVSGPIVETKTNETVSLPSKDSNENLPQDSMLRRHYLANLRAMVVSLNPPRPTDSCLSRHYDSLIISKIEECLRDKGAIERLICKYEDHKKSLVQQIREHIKPAEPLLKAEAGNEGSTIESEYPKLPEDSVLRRHTITHLKSIAESNM
jgi:hypothetical protein